MRWRAGLQVAKAVITARALIAPAALLAPAAFAQNAGWPAVEAPNAIPPSTNVWSFFTPRGAAARTAPTFPATVPLPRPAPRAERPQPTPTASAAPVARQDELTATAYNNTASPRVAETEQNFVTWLPRLVSNFEPPPPATAFVAAQPRPPGELRPREAPLSPLVGTPRISPRRVPDDLAALIAAKAHKYGVPIDLAHAVVTVESNYDPSLTGGGATIGLMQIKHATARGMGFAGTPRELYDPATNLEWGMKYLGTARKLARGDLCGTVLRYQAGHRASGMNPVAREYCTRVRFLLEASAMHKRATRSAQAAPRL